jgi:hypothetical protein
MFFGMVVMMHEHAPPHFHVVYQGFEASIAIETGELMKGKLPPSARRLLREWTQRHRNELLENWQRGRLYLPFLAVQGADEDE